MKFLVYIFCFYLFALTALPSVRAIKMQFSENCQSSCQKNTSNTDEPSGCEKGKIIMNLSFYPVYYETSQSLSHVKENIFFQIATPSKLFVFFVTPINVNALLWASKTSIQLIL